MEMHQIRYFLAVCETLNFTRAAERCNVSQPALSRAIQSLEAEVGGPLFRRERSLTHMTDLGRLLRPHLEDSLRETEAAKLAARNFLKLEGTPLQLGVMCTIGPLRFVGFLAQFRDDNPGVELSLIEGVPAQLIDKLEHGSLDIAIMAHPDPFPDENLFFRSDNATLAHLGVPAHTISTLDIDVDPDYHRPSDHVTTLDLTHLTTTIRAIATGVRYVVWGEASPTRIDPTQFDP